MSEVTSQKGLEKSAYQSSSAQANEVQPSEIKGNERPLWAWTQCLGSFCLFLSSWGLINSFGVFESFYNRTRLTGESASRVAWIGSLQAFLIIFGGIVAGPLFDKGYSRALICIGSVLVVFGMMMTSLSKSYWQLVLAQALVVGIGCGCLFVPSVAILPLYFTKHRALSMGIGAAGVSVGGLIFPVMFRQLEPQLGFGWTTRVIAFVILAVSIIPMATMAPPKSHSATNTDRRLDMSVWKEPPFFFFAVGTFMAFLGLYIPYFYVQLYGQTNSFVNSDSAFYLVAILNAGALFGRIIPNIIADRIGRLGPVLSIATCCLGATILAFTWIAVHDTPGLVVFCIFYGFFSGGFISLGPTVVVSLSPSLDVVGRRMGLLFGPCSIGLLIGNPIAGAIVKRGWLGLQLFCAVSLFAATVSMGVVWIFKRRTDTRGL